MTSAAPAATEGNGDRCRCGRAFAVAWTVTHAPSVASDNLRTLHASRPADVVVTMGCGDACRSSPESGTRTGNCPTPLASLSTRSVRSVTTSKSGSAACSTNSASPPSASLRSDRTPSVLFVCVKNGGKSQMAAGLMTKIAGDTVQVYSAGTKPATAVNDLSAQALAEVGVDITGNTPTLIDPQLVRAVDVVVTLGREARVDPVVGTRFENWGTVEPSTRGIDGIERMRLVRDDIAARVADLLDRMQTGSS